MILHNSKHYQIQLKGRLSEEVKMTYWESAVA